MANRGLTNVRIRQFLDESDSDFRDISDDDSVDVLYFLCNISNTEENTIGISIEQDLTENESEAVKEIIASEGNYDALIMQKQPCLSLNCARQDLHGLLRGGR